MFAFALLATLFWKPAYHLILVFKYKDEEKDKENLAIIRKHFTDLIELIKP